ncbi:MAG: hypothetical protein AAB897_00975 [Patescibacteria group bacterium]
MKRNSVFVLCFMLLAVSLALAQDTPGQGPQGPQGPQQGPPGDLPNNQTPEVRKQTEAEKIQELQKRIANKEKEVGEKEQKHQALIKESVDKFGFTAEELAVLEELVAEKEKNRRKELENRVPEDKRKQASKIIKSLKDLTKKRSELARLREDLSALQARQDSPESVKSGSPETKGGSFDKKAEKKIAEKIKDLETELARTKSDFERKKIEREREIQEEQSEEKRAELEEKFANFIEDNREKVQKLETRIEVLQGMPVEALRREDDEFKKVAPYCGLRDPRDFWGDPQDTIEDLDLPDKCTYVDRVSVTVPVGQISAATAAVCTARGMLWSNQLTINNLSALFFHYYPVNSPPLLIGYTPYFPQLSMLQFELSPISRDQLIAEICKMGGVASAGDFDWVEVLTASPSEAHSPEQMLAQIFMDPQRRSGGQMSGFPAPKSEMPDFGLCNIVFDPTLSDLLLKEGEAFEAIVNSFSKELQPLEAGLQEFEDFEKAIEQLRKNFGSNSGPEILALAEKAESSKYLLPYASELRNIAGKAGAGDLKGAKKDLEKLNNKKIKKDHKNLLKEYVRYAQHIARAADLRNQFEFTAIQTQGAISDLIKIKPKEERDPLYALEKKRMESARAFQDRYDDLKKALARELNDADHMEPVIVDFGDKRMVLTSFEGVRRNQRTMSARLKMKFSSSYLPMKADGTIDLDAKPLDDAIPAVFEIDELLGLGIKGIVPPHGPIVWLEELKEQGHKQVTADLPKGKPGRNFVSVEELIRFGGNDQRLMIDGQEIALTDLAGKGVYLFLVRSNAEPDPTYHPDYIPSRENQYLSVAKFVAEDSAQNKTVKKQFTIVRLIFESKRTLSTLNNEENPQTIEVPFRLRPGLYRNRFIVYDVFQKKGVKLPPIDFRVLLPEETPTQP